MTEHQLYDLIAIYLQTQYPGVIYRFDLAADLKLTPAQARRHKKLHPLRGHPDLLISEPVWFYKDKRIRQADLISQKVKLPNDVENLIPYSGLYLEIKKDGVRLTKKNGELIADEHVREQYDYLHKLNQRGYYAQFGVGFEECKAIIDDYLGGKNG